MGWANCGNDSMGRPIGYAHAATCDHPGCDIEIDRGLSFACGGMHGQDEVSCEKYFCPDHLTYAIDSKDELHNICIECAELLKSGGEWVENEEEGALVQVKSPAEEQGSC